MLKGEAKAKYQRQYMRSYMQGRRQAERENDERIKRLEREVAELRGVLKKANGNGHVAMVESDAFEQFWDAYPKRDGANPKKPAKGKFQRHVENGVNPNDIIQGAQRYARQVLDKEPKYVAQAVTWLNQERWNDDDWVAPREESYTDIAERLRREIAEEEMNGKRNHDNDTDLFGSTEFTGPRDHRHY